MPTVYLDAALGDDSRTYVQAQNPATPWETIEKFLASGFAGDTCQMAAGDYAWVENQDVSNRTFIGEDWRTTFIDAAGDYAFWKANGTVNLSNLTFLNNDADGTTGYGNVNCRGVFTPNGASAVEWNFVNCSIEDCALTRSYTGLGGLFSQTIVILGGYGTNYNNSIFNLSGCRIVRPRSIASSSGQECPIFSAEANITNCVIYTDEATYPIKQISEDADVVFANCLIQNDGSSFAFGDGSVDYSNVYGITSVPAGTGNLAVDSEFIDPVNGDFHVSQDSPVRGMGIRL